MGTSSTKAKNSIHLCGGDNRLIGINLYFRGFGSKDFYLLNEISLTDGGKHHWKIYNADTESAYGYFAGNLVINSPVETTRDGQDGDFSYDATTCVVNLTNTARGFTDRNGDLRLPGFYIDPLYVTLASMSTQNKTVNVINGAAGITKIKAELLDETFAIVKESAEVEYTVLESGIAPPNMGSDDDPSS